MYEQGKAATFKESQLHHKRGHFPAVNVGVTHSQGTKEPKYLNLDPQIEIMISHLLGMAETKHVVTFANGKLLITSQRGCFNSPAVAFATWSPRLFDYYRTYTDKLFEKMPHLPCIFGAKCVFPCATFNFGPHICTLSHCDQMNLPFGLCAMQSLGWFDYGGHLVLANIKNNNWVPCRLSHLTPLSHPCPSQYTCSATWDSNVTHTILCRQNLLLHRQWLQETGDPSQGRPC